MTPGLFGDQVGDAARRFLSGVLLLSLLVLIAACVNLASIFAARAADRGRELAIRMAIGSSRWRMLRQVLSEAALLSVLGGAAGTFVAAALLKLLSQWRPIPGASDPCYGGGGCARLRIAILLAAASCILRRCSRRGRSGRSTPCR